MEHNAPVKPIWMSSVAISNKAPNRRSFKCCRRQTDKLWNTERLLFSACSATMATIASNELINSTSLPYSPSLMFELLIRYVADVTNCILDKYTRGTDFCSSRASTHFGRIFDVMLQGVQCKSGGYSTFNTFDTSNSFNNNPAFNRFPSNSGGSSNFPNNQNNNFGSNSGSFPNQNFPQQGSGSNFGGQGNFGMNSNWPQNQQNSGFGMNSGSNWPQNQNSFGQNSGSNWPQNQNSFGSGSFGQSSNNFGQDSGFGSSGTIPPYNPNRRPSYYNSGSAIQATMTMVVTTIFAACLAI